MVNTCPLSSLLRGAVVCLLALSVLAGCGNTPTTSTGSTDGGSDSAVADADLEGTDAASTELDIASDSGGPEEVSTPDGDGVTGSDIAVAPPVPCATDSQCDGGKCLAGKQVCVACENAADCPSGSKCQAFECVPGVACTGDLQCKETNQVCDKATGFCAACVTTNDCQRGQQCAAGLCIAAPTACTSSKQCPVLCDTAKSICVDCLGHSDCAANQFCAGGQCLPDVCSKGTCVEGKALVCASAGEGYAAPVDCSDNNACTTDSCKDGACSHTPVSGLTCSDNDPCTEGDTCQDGSCTSTPMVCNDNNSCTDDKCKDGACDFAKNATPCNDDNTCTTDDICADGTCVGKVVVCNDQNACTTDACVGGLCVFTKLEATPCDDGSACTDSDGCAGGTCVGVLKNCDDNNACTNDTCKDGVCDWAKLADIACDDGLLCTTTDSCVAGVCVGVAVECNDNNTCTTDSCQDGACQFDKLTGDTCTDGDPCTLQDACNAGVCTGTAKVCVDDNACTADQCTDGQCVFQQLVNTPCSDNNACTSGDKCSGGSCTGTTVVCNDDNFCTDDGCDGTQGCTFVNNQLDCGAAASCGQCQAGSCVPNAALGWSLVDGVPGHRQPAVAVLAFGDDTLSMQSGSGLGGLGGTDALVRRHNPAGVPQWSYVFGTSGDEVGHALIAWKEGAAIIGERVLSGGQHVGWIVTINSSGTLQNEWLVEQAGQDLRLERAVQHGDFIYATGMRATSGGNSQPVLVRVSQSGVVESAANTPYFTAITDIVVTATGKLFVVGYIKTSSGNTYVGLVAAVQETPFALGTAKEVFTSVSNSAGLDAVAALPDGTLWLAGMRYNAQNLSEVCLLRYDPATGTATVPPVCRTVESGYYFAIGDCTVLSDGSAVVVGGTPASSGNPGWGFLFRVATNGTEVWYKDVPWNQGLHWYGVAAHGTNTVLAGGWHFPPAADSEGYWIQELGSKGDIACSCTTDAECLDTDTCTEDVCILGQCSHPAAADGIPCSQGICISATCQAAQCGDGVCSSGENASGCPADCQFCGDDICSAGESLQGCPTDCSTCGDSLCTGGEAPMTCPSDCGYCGDNWCNDWENNVVCSKDCAASHICNAACGAPTTPANATVECYCDSTCGNFGDCCTSDGKGTSKYGCDTSTCAACKVP